VPTALIDGITTRYETTGSGPPLLMFSPGGFNSRLENWTSLGLYSRLHLLDHLAPTYTCITFDRRESGLSGGRLERVTWSHYVAQGVGLLDHLGIDKAHLMGGCAGCSVVAAFGASVPQRVSSMVLFSPAGGARYRITQHDRFAEHLAYVDANGLEQVVTLARSHDDGFSQDARVGPWVTVIRTDSAFAEAYGKQDPGRYRLMVSAMAQTLFDRDTVPGAEPEDLLRLDIPALIVPGQDTSHATSAARYLQECLVAADYWDVPVSAQTEETAPARVLEFLDAV
jgi:pimeloyl-ACP methyl ester carboxylesterase